jgi:GLPGLI family protein
MKQPLLFFVFLLVTASTVTAQRKVSELMLSYDTQISTGSAEPKMADAFDGSVTTVYIKGNLSRSEMTSALFSSAIIHDTKTGSAVALREVSGQKLLIRMTAENWAEKNRKYDGIVFTNTTESKVIAGYKCTKATATMKDGSTFVVYYTSDIIPENRDYDYMFKNLNGLPLEWELVQGKLKIKYTLSKINLNPIPVSRFDIPKSGYRELTYEESKKTNSN